MFSFAWLPLTLWRIMPSIYATDLLREFPPPFQPTCRAELIHSWSTDNFNLILVSKAILSKSLSRVFLYRQDWIGASLCWTVNKDSAFCRHVNNEWKRSGGRKGIPLLDLTQWTPFVSENISISSAFWEWARSWTLNNKFKNESESKWHWEIVFFSLDDSLVNFKEAFFQQNQPTRNSSNLLLISRELSYLSPPSATVIQVMASILNSDASTSRLRCHLEIEGGILQIEDNVNLKTGT